MGTMWFARSHKFCLCKKNICFLFSAVINGFDLSFHANNPFFNMMMTLYCMVLNYAKSMYKSHLYISISRILLS